MPSRSTCLLLVCELILPIGFSLAVGSPSRREIASHSVRRLPGGPVDRRVGLVDAVASSPEGMREVATERRVSDIDALHSITDAATDCGAGALGRGASSARATPKPVGAAQ